MPEEYNGLRASSSCPTGRVEMLDLDDERQGSTTTMKYKVPTRGLLGLRNAILTCHARYRRAEHHLRRATAPGRATSPCATNGSLVAHETGQVTTYAHFTARRSAAS